MESFEDQLATAFVAKMAGMTLKQVDDSTTHRAGGLATRIDPASFLTVVQERKKEEKQREIDQLNKMAEQMYPLPEPVQPLTPLQFTPPQQFINTQENNNVNITNSSELVDVLKSIDNSLKEFVEYFRVSVNGIKK